MLRALAALLLLANLLFFVWTQGWLSPLVPAPHQGEREPERLAAQVRPEIIQIITPQAASAAVAAAVAAAAVCLEAGPFNDAEVGVAEAALVAASVPAAAVERRDVQPPPQWLVYMGRFGDAAALRTKQEELRRLKLSFDELREPPDLAPGLVLSRHESQEAAEAALAPLVKRGLRTAKVVALAQGARHWLRAQRAAPELQGKLATLKPPLIAAAFLRCLKN
jgi:hypothetical protein